MTASSNTDDCVNHPTESITDLGIRELEITDLEITDLGITDLGIRDLGISDHDRSRPRKKNIKTYFNEGLSS